MSETEKRYVWIVDLAVAPLILRCELIRETGRGALAIFCGQRIAFHEGKPGRFLFYDETEAREFLALKLCNTVLRLEAELADWRQKQADPVEIRDGSTPWPKDGEALILEAEADPS